MDIPWSSERVYELTVAKIRQAGWSLATLTEKEDVDTIDELNRLRLSLSQTGVGERQLAATLDAILGDR